ncbi:hypothetical protein DL96DRAFT_635856 [Flagelloscypha sp. PMI_526]|nr:hypothetical protein DL96DRAFT_635856 [Flagelloscypha sp. PMI_526]
MTMAPFSISHVCSEWRRLSLRTPTLWTNLRVQIDDEFSDSKAILLNAFLARSRNEPLTIFLHFNEIKNSRSVVDDGGQFHYLQPLFDQHLRWCSVDFRIPVSLLRSSLFPIEEVPLLIKFSLTVLPFHIGAAQNHPVIPRILIRNSPLLSYLILENFFGTFFDTFTAGSTQDISRLFDWNNITTFGLWDPVEQPLSSEDYFNTEEVQSLLSVTPSVKSWTGAISAFPNASTGPHSRVSHQHLQSAQLLISRSTTLDHLEFMALKSLSLTLERDPESSNILRDFLQRSPHLERVQFQGWTSELLYALESIGLPLKEVTFRCLSSPKAPSFRSAISVLNRDNIPTLEKVTLLLRPDIDCEYDISASVVETGRQLALDAESRGHPTTISFVAYSDELEEVINEALNNLEELALANLEITRMHLSL